MPDRECKKRWDKENVRMVVAKLFITKPEDKAIYDFLQEQESVSGAVKAALKEYMENHKGE